MLKNDDLQPRMEKFSSRAATGPKHYLAAGVFVVVAAIGQISLAHLITGYGFILFFPAVTCSAWFGGPKPGFFAVALSLALVLGLPSIPTTGLLHQPWLPVCLFAVFSSGITLLIGRMQQLMTRLQGAHRELYNQHQWFRITLKSIGDAVVVTDRDGGVVFMNAEAERLTGWMSSEAAGKPLRSVFRIISEESRKSVDDPVEKVFREKRVVGLANHTLLISKGGAEWPIEDSASPIHDESNEILGVVLVFHDATELRRNQRSLKAHSDELEHKVFERTVALQRTVNDLEAFSYSISHDLRSPLRAMLGYAEALLEDFPAMPSLATDYLQKIARSAKRLDHLIQDLLTFSRIAHDHESIAPVNLDSLVRDIVQQYPDFQGRADITIESPLPIVLGHETSLTQVVSNLIANAIKFVPKERRPKIKIKASERDHFVRIDFIDNGIGIAPENQQRIFKMFEQINPIGTYTGTGIGLAVVKKAVEKMQGSLGVESEVGTGSTFWIELIKAKTP